MKALVKYELGPGNMEIRDIPEPTCGDDQIKIKVKKAGICGSDLHIFHNDIAIPLNPPVVTGHEFSGVIAEVGKNVKDFRVGERVVSETAYSYCGVCDHCNEGFYNLCNERRTLGYWYNGIFTDYTVVPAGRVHRIPDNVSFTTAAMTEPLACVCHAVYDLSHIESGDVVLVSGPGAIGLMALQVAKAEGATVVVSGLTIDADRLEMAKELGADYAVNVQETDLSEFLQSITDGNGADVVLECSGAAPAINAALLAVKKRGYFVQIGLPGKKIEFDIEKVCYKELKFSGSLGSRKHSWKRALKLMKQEKVNLEVLANVQLPLTEWETAFVRFEKKDGCKFLLIPESELDSKE